MTILIARQLIPSSRSRLKPSSSRITSKTLHGNRLFSSLGIRRLLLIIGKDGKFNIPKIASNSQNTLAVKARLPYQSRNFQSIRFKSSSARYDYDTPLEDLDIESRMQQLGTQPFRKITVADVIRPGPRPSLPTCLQTCRITADELSVRLCRRVYEINNLPPDVKSNHAIVAILNIYKETFKELYQYTRKVEKLRVTAVEPSTIQRIWTKITGNNDSKSEILAPKEQDLENIQYGDECTDPILLLHSRQLTSDFIFILKNIVKRHQPV